MITRNRTRYIIDFCILILFLASLVWAFRFPVRQELSVEMYYRNAPEGILSQLFWGTDGNLSAENCSDGQRDGNIVLFSLPQSPRELKMLRIDPSNTEEVYSITRISFLLNGEYFRAMNADEILEKFVPVNADLTLSGEELIITSKSADSGLLIDSDELNASAVEASDALRARQIRQRCFSLLFLSAALIALVHCAPSLRRYFISLFSRDECGRFDWFSLIATAVMAGALLVVLVIGLGSELGLHPDEWDVKACLDYGMTHFLPPDMRDPAVANTYSGYGYTKLENYTWYFFLAGKIALLFRTLFYSLPYYRIPNLLLFAALAILFARNIRRKNWLMAALGICVQAWYIFSYTTADALDFFLAFFAVYLLSSEDSLLFRAVDTVKLTGKSIPGFLLLGFLFGMIALGKPNYLSILALVFFVLLFRLIRQKNPEQKKALWRNYFLILGIFAAVFLFRAGFDLYHYGTQKAAVKEAVAIEHAHEDKNPATPVEEQNPSWHMMSRGATLQDFFDENPEWFSMSYKSFCGLIQDTDTGLWYYACMGFFYAVLLAGIACFAFRYGDFWTKLEFLVGILLMAGGVAASVINSYVIDSQAQGRYLLPLILIAGYLASRTPRLFEKWYFRLLLAAAGVFSVGYFGLVGVPLFL